MCGRFTYLYRWRELVELMRLVGVPAPELTPRYNVAPTQMAPVVRATTSARAATAGVMVGSAAAREGVLLRWGLVPSWADDASVGSRSVNARCETVATKPTFRDAFVHRRCLVPISGFYEWRVMGDGAKQPYYITRVDGAPFVLGGVWEPPTRALPEVGTFTILTTTPNALMRSLHDRMPVIVAASDFDLWLGPGHLPASEAVRLMQPFADTGFEAHSVGRMVNSPSNEGPDLIARVSEPDSRFLF